MFKYILLVLCTITQSFANYNFLGRYDLEVRIGDQLFKDSLVIAKVIKNEVYGSFEVPNVFKADLSGSIEDNRLLGKFIATERGESSRVDLSARINIDSCNLVGDLSINNEVFGVFLGKKRGCDE